MGWKKQQLNNQRGDRTIEGGLKVGSWNKGGVNQPLEEKLNEIETLIKSNNFTVMGISEANFFQHNDIEDVQIPGFRFFNDKGRNNSVRRNSRCVLYVGNDLTTNIRDDLMEEEFPEIWVEIGKKTRRGYQFVSTIENFQFGI